jgi:hypothetical protein
VCSEGGLDVLDSAAAVAALVAELIEGDVEFIFSQFVALRCCASVLMVFLREWWMVGLCRSTAAWSSSRRATVWRFRV